MTSTERTTSQKVSILTLIGIVVGSMVGEGCLHASQELRLGDRRARRHHRLGHHGHGDAHARFRLSVAGFASARPG